MKKYKIFIILFTLVVLCADSLLAFNIITKLDSSTKKKNDFSYDCDSFDKAVLASNRGTVKYFKSNLLDYSEVFISPLSIQGSLYNCLDEDNPKLFKYFGNGFQSWSKSGELFKEDGFKTIESGKTYTSHELVGTLQDLSFGFITDLAKEIDFSSKTTFSVFYYNAVMKNAIFDENKSLICVDDEVLYKETSSYKSIKLMCSDNKHAMYFIDGDLKNFSFDNFEKKKLKIGVSPYIWQTIGSVDDLVKRFNVHNINLKVIEQFGFDSKFYKKGVADNIDIIYAQDYYIILVNEETGLILGLGSR